MILRPFRTCVIFGGTGFIGSHFAAHLLEQQLGETIYLADVNPLAPERCQQILQPAADQGRVQFIPCDVRQPISHPDLPPHVDLIANLAAVHREPGHEPHEYFATNLPGAENVCAWAEKVDCPWIVFTSSIAPYGPSEEEKDENSLPVPISPYGASKLTAEKIHFGWQRSDKGRLLTIVRPGVVFGAGEGGNVSRMIKAVLGRYFFYMGNRKTRKAGGYIKELCHALTWVMNWQEANGKATALFNFSMDPAPTVEEYVETICKVAGRQRLVPSIPYLLLLSSSYPIEAMSRVLGIHQPINPVRIRKLIRSNNIMPKFLQEHRYQYRYTLEQALAEWREERPEEWT
jgi:nucleoside-diphosphate-sugar epimerase